MTSGSSLFFRSVLYASTDFTVWLMDDVMALSTIRYCGAVSWIVLIPNTRSVGWLDVKVTLLKVQKSAKIAFE